MTVPMQTPGAKSLPAELKVGGGNPFARMRAEHPGYGTRTRTGWENRMWMHPGRHFGLNGFPIQAGPVNPLVLNPIAAMAAARTRGAHGLHGMYGLGDGDAAGTPMPAFVSNDPIPFPESTPLPPGADLMAGLDSIAPQIPGWNGPGLLTPSVAPPTPPVGYQWAQVLDSTGKTLAQILAISQGGSVTQLPNGLRIVQGSQAGAVQGAGGGFLTGGSGGVTGVLGGNSGMLLLGVGVVLLVMMFRQGRG